MSRVMAHTSKIGYHTLSYQSRWLYGSRYGTPSILYGVTPVSGLSYKSTTVKSDGIRPTSYSRCAARIFPGKGGSFKTSTHSVKATDANIVQMCNIDAFGGDCNLPVGYVYIPEYLEGSAINTAKQQISQVSANVLEDLAQAHQVKDMAVSIYNQIWDYAFIYAHKGKRWKSLRGYLLSRAKSFPKHLGDAWLFYYYGIKPLVSTFNQVMSEYKGGTYSVKGFGQASDTLPIGHFIPDGSAGTITGTAKRSVKVYLRGRIKTTSNLQYWRGLGLSGQDGSASDLDGLVTLWAITPYSFVFDWMIPVENFLRSLYWAPEIVYQFGWISRYIDGDGTCVATHFSGNPIIEGDAPSCKAKLLYFQRVAYNNFPPLARLYLNVSLKPNQLLSAAALVAVRG